MVRARRVLPASVRSTAAGMTPLTSDSTIANSPEYRPVVIWTLAPWTMSARPVIAWRLILATRLAAAAALASAPVFAALPPDEAVFGGG